MPSQRPQANLGGPAERLSKPSLLGGPEAKLGSPMETAKFSPLGGSMVTPLVTEEITPTSRSSQLTLGVSIKPEPVADQSIFDVVPAPAPIFDSGGGAGGDGGGGDGGGGDGGGGDGGGGDGGGGGGDGGGGE